LLSAPVRLFDPAMLQPPGTSDPKSALTP
jgi:hypothetical protein